MTDRPLSEVYVAIANLAIALGVTKIRTVPGCWTYKRGREFIAVNPHDEIEKVTIPPDGGTLDLGPHHAVMCVNGWIVYLGNPFDGRVFMIDEDNVIARIRALQRSIPKALAA